MISSLLYPYKKLTLDCRCHKGNIDAALFWITENHAAAEKRAQAPGAEFLRSGLEAANQAKVVGKSAQGTFHQY